MSDSSIGSIGAKISEYYCAGEGLDFDDHRFTVDIVCGSLKYSVDRSYVDFVNLDRQIRKTYPRTKIDHLPLEATSYVSRVLKLAATEKRSSTSATKRGSIDMSTVIDGDGLSQSKSIKIPRDSSFVIERVDNKVATLNSYLTVVLSHHELMASKELQLFFDEEAISMATDLSLIEPLTVIDVLLINETVNKCTVTKLEEANYLLNPGQLIIWRFSTADFDIGFCVEMDHEVKVALTRYKSHEKPICGTMEATQKALCTLKFDNTHSKLRSKKLQWVARVIEMDEYDNAKEQALEAQRERKKFETQRGILQHCAIQHGSMLSGVTHSSSVVHQHAAEESQDKQELLLQVASLQSENREQRNEIEMLQLSLEECRSEKDYEVDELKQKIHQLHLSHEQLGNDQREELQKLYEIQEEKLTEYETECEEANAVANDAEEMRMMAEEARDKISASWRFTVTQLDTTRSELQALKTKYNEVSNDKDLVNAELKSLKIKNDELNEILSASADAFVDSEKKYEDFQASSRENMLLLEARLNENEKKHNETIEAMQLASDRILREDSEQQEKFRLEREREQNEITEAIEASRQQTLDRLKEKELLHQETVRKLEANAVIIQSLKQDLLVNNEKISSLESTLVESDAKEAKSAIVIAEMRARDVLLVEQLDDVRCQYKMLHEMVSSMAVPLNTVLTAQLPQVMSMLESNPSTSSTVMSPFKSRTSSPLNPATRLSDA